MKKKKLLIYISSFLLLAVIISAVLNVINYSSKKNSGCAAGSCSGCGGCGGNSGSKTVVNSTYYIDKKDELLQNLSDTEKVFENVLADSFSKQEIESISRETTEEFEKLIPQIPYVVGDENQMTEDVEKAAMVLAFYRVADRYDLSTDEVGDIVYTGIEKELQKYPHWLLRLSAGKYFTNSYIVELKNQADLSQKKLYPGDWVCQYEPVDQEDYDFGYNFTECAIVKFFEEQNASELTPYLCKLDYLYSDYMDEGLVRTSTLAEGGKYCDFRYKRVENPKLDVLTWSAIVLACIAVITLIAFVIRIIYIKFWKELHGKKKRE
ncbi:MAG: L-2-amino-thiazoline-4-carboxylic acid hydrolase [Bacillota bacterium]